MWLSGNKVYTCMYAWLRKREKIDTMQQFKQTNLQHDLVGMIMRSMRKLNSVSERHIWSEISLTFNAYSSREADWKTVFCKFQEWKWKQQQQKLHKFYNFTKRQMYKRSTTTSRRRRRQRGDFQSEKSELKLLRIVHTNNSLKNFF